MPTLIELKALPNFRLWLRYSDGEEGVVDLSKFAGKGVFAAWSEGGFEKAGIGDAGEIRWGREIDFCPDAAYLRLTGKSPEEVFPNLTGLVTNAGN